MKILQLNITSLQSFYNQLKFYQGQNGNYIIALKETNVKEESKMFRNWKRKSFSIFNDKKLGFGVATLIKNDVKSVFVNNIQPNLEAIWDLFEINEKQTLVGNMYIPSNESKLVNKRDIELKKTMTFHCCYLVTLMPGIQFGIKIVRQLKKMVKFWKTL